MATTNSLGFGSLASVAWTDMNGTDLTDAQLDEVDSDISAASTIASALIDVIKGAVKLGLTRFKLSDLSAGYFQLTDLRTSTSSTTDDGVTDWADFISQVTGQDISASRDLSLNEWRAVAAQLQDHASQQASRIDPFRSETGKANGGIKTVNGHWYVNGQQLSLLDAYMAIRVNQVANFDDSLNIYIAELNENNRLVQGANDWLSTLRSEKPTTTNAATLSSSFRTSFSSVWGFDPVLAYHPTDTSGTTISNMSAPSGYKSFDTWIDNVKGYVDAKDTSNQTVQQKLEQMTNRRSEVLDGLTSFAKAQTQTGSSFARNLG